MRRNWRHLLRILISRQWSKKTRSCEKRRKRKIAGCPLFLDKVMSPLNKNLRPNRQVKNEPKEASLHAKTALRYWICFCCHLSLLGTKTHGGGVCSLFDIKTVVIYIMTWNLLLKELKKIFLISMNYFWNMAVLRPHISLIWHLRCWGSAK